MCITGLLTIGERLRQIEKLAKVQLVISDHFKLRRDGTIFIPWSFKVGNLDGIKPVKVVSQPSGQMVPQPWSIDPGANKSVNVGQYGAAVNSPRYWQTTEWLPEKVNKRKSSKRRLSKRVRRKRLKKKQDYWMRKLTKQGVFDRNWKLPFVVKEKLPWKPVEIELDDDDGEVEVVQYPDEDEEARIRWGLARRGAQKQGA
eukprot:TRINITY_DN67212_c3_g1_i1.p1 TRINITY_DN67212_c3_g1~~TRINITY_DN67212_c3_g1_i1.p1  ORF type:complete len:200 (-),score=20.14 TRINITY_DN67212_c3_g1_i1:69-668(-)